jgi:carbon starvation protein CstA
MSGLICFLILAWMIGIAVTCVRAQVARERLRQNPYTTIFALLVWPLALPLGIVLAWYYGRLLTSSEVGR